MSKVALGLSGGVDSSVAAHLLKEARHKVVGVHLLLAPDASRDSRAVQDARAVSAHFGLPFHVVDLREAFQREVIAPFAEAYLSGRTPNPCVRCNAQIKFGLLWQEAARLGCEMLATGHYVRIVQDAAGAHLLPARDAKKDQSYFLWGMPAAMLKRTLCPLGDYTKDEVRALAARLGLVTAGKKESQEICFIPGDDYAAFLSSYCPEKLPGAGDFISPDGAVLGRHQGSWRYTVGQRRGLGLALGYPAYVLATDAAQGTVSVGPDDALWHRGLYARQVNFLQTPKESGRALAKIRSRDRGTMAHWRYDGQNLRVIFDEPVRAITPGQSVVLYEEGRVALGGIITKHFD